MARVSVRVWTEANREDETRLVEGALSGLDEVWAEVTSVLSGLPPGLRKQAILDYGWSEPIAQALTESAADPESDAQWSVDQDGTIRVTDEEAD